MRTLLAALAIAFAVPATATTAAACGGDQIVAAPIVHTASGSIGFMGRNDAGRLAMFVSYPTIDGENSMLYGIDVELAKDRMSRAFAQDYARWEKRLGGLTPVASVELERTGETGAWRLVSYRFGARS